VLFLESPSADSVVVRVLEEGQPGSASHLLVVNEEVTLKWSDLAEVRLLQGSLAHADIEKDSGGGGSSSGSSSSSGGGNSAGGSSSGGNNSGSTGTREMIRPNFGRQKQANKSSKKKANAHQVNHSKTSNSSIEDSNIGSGSSSGGVEALYVDDLTDFQEMIMLKRQRLEAPASS
jgi:hypothetical protein